ncbi:prepilin-type N-terminal cleavage/methylation domain-containing protein [Aeromonas media]|uniref:prepilin-type N-terminal cleavage/methylation domain-containing protein n=1 Tax=Aeromonas media TaxID=651 RepID=UPI001CF5172A|nr:prepilin-type N-terminal cleavage/methylation domain-containing protein [Aeromonas media]
MLRRHRMKGFNLVELMVAMVAGLLLVAAASALFASILKANKTAMQVSRLNQELQSITDMMARDIQRAGYDASAAAHTLSGEGSDFSFDSTTDLASNCIWVRYDDNENGVLDNTSAAGETRLYNYSSADNAVRFDQGGTASCSNGSRINTEATVEITDLTFTLLPSSISSGARTIRLTISGNDIKSPALALTLQRDIKLRNDGFLP